MSDSTQLHSDGTAQSMQPVIQAKLLEDEIPQIRRRRVKARKIRRPDDQPSPEQPEQDDREIRESLVGLALSGGGVRSGAMSLGVLQVLDQDDRLREFDYCSSVSGGSYAASYLASHAVRQAKSDQPLINEPLNIRQPKGYPAPRKLLEFIYNGDYLRDSVGFFNRQLFGMVLLMTMVGSGIGCAAFLVAWLVRNLDRPAVQDCMIPLGFSTEFRAALFPFLLAATVWFIGWCLCYWRRSGDRPPRTQRFLFGTMIVAGAISLAMILGAGDLSFGSLPSQVRVHDAFESTLGKAWGLVLAVVGAAILPFLNPRRLVQSGATHASPLERLTYRIASWALLVGIPFAFLMVALFENVSYHNDIRGHEIVNRAEFMKWSHGRTGSPFWNRLAATQGSIPRPSDSDEWLHSHLNRLPGYLDALKHQTHAGDGSQHGHDTTVGHRQLPGLPQHSPDDQSGTRERLAPILHRFGPLTEVNSRLRPLLDNPPLRTNWYWMIAGALSAWSDPQNPYTDFRMLLNESNRIKEDIAAKFGELMEERDFAQSVLCLPADPAKLIHDDFDWLDADQFRTLVRAHAALAGAIQNHWLVHGGSSRGGSTVPTKSNQTEAHDEALHNLVRANRDILVAWCPDGMLPTTEIRTHIVIQADQDTRLWYAICSGLVCLFLCFVISLNATSCHNFYRDRLGAMWMEDIPGIERTEVPLSQLETCDEGYPYHLIVGSTSFPFRTDPANGPRKVDHFLFSQRYCGSERTGYLPSGSKAFAEIKLNDAVAISGAAVSVLHLGNPLIVFLLFITNLRLGKWLRNPAVPQAQEPLLSRLLGCCGVTPLRVLSTINRVAEKRPFLFVADGGHFENLAVDELLRRRCRVILALDAGADPDNQLTDLTRLVRWARMRHGVELELVKEVSADPVAIQELAEVADELSMVVNKDGDQRLFSRLESKRPTVFAKRHGLVFRICYPVANDAEETENAPDGRKDQPGWLILMKSTLTGDEPLDLVKHFQRNNDFPHDATTDQFYDPGRFESYRQLGQHICEILLPQFDLALKLTDSEPTAQPTEPPSNPPAGAEVPDPTGGPDSPGLAAMALAEIVVSPVHPLEAGPEPAVTVDAAVPDEDIQQSDQRKTMLATLADPVFAAAQRLDAVLSGDGNDDPSPGGKPAVPPDDAAPSVPVGTGPLPPKPSPVRDSRRDSGTATKTRTRKKTKASKKSRAENSKLRRKNPR